MRTLFGMMMLAGMLAGQASGQLFYANDSTDQIAKAPAVFVADAPGSATTADIDELGDTLYFASYGPTGQGIYTVPKAGGVPSLIGDLTPDGIFDVLTSIAVSSDGSKVYASTGALKGTLLVLDTGAGTFSDLVDVTAAPLSVDRFNIRGLDIDEANGKIYWTDVTADGIFSADLADGGNAAKIADTAALVSAATGGNVTSSSPDVVTVDPAGGRIFWFEDSSSFEGIWVADLDGSNASLLVDLETAGYDNGRTSWGVEDIQYFNGRLYFGDTSFNGIWSLGLDSLDFASEVTPDGDNVRGVTIPEPTSMALLAGSLLLAMRRRQA